MKSNNVIEFDEINQFNNQTCIKNKICINMLNNVSAINFEMLLKACGLPLNEISAISYL